MIFKDEYDSSIWSRCFFVTIMLTAVLAVCWQMFAEASGAGGWWAAHRIGGDFARRVILASCFFIYFARLLLTVFVFLKRKWVWREAALVSILMPLALYGFAQAGGDNPQPIGGTAVVGVLLYLAGSFLNTCSEYTRHVWKKKDDNQGRLYTGGLFKYSMHINYFGDVVLFTGLALITGNLVVLAIPLFMALNFLFFIIPRLDKYLAEKYGDEFREYARRTRRFIPFIF